MPDSSNKRGQVHKNITRSQMNKMIIFGEGKYAEQAYYYFTNDSPHEVVAFTADEAYIQKTDLFGLPIIPFEKIEAQYPPNEYKMFVALGYQNMNKLRASKYEAAREKGYELVSYISSKACNYGGVEFGDNCFILDNAVIQPCSKIGSNVYIWSGNHVGHHASVGDHCYIAGQAVISGSTSIGPYCFVGVKATIGHEIIVGEESLIGAGAVITKDVSPKSVHIVESTPKLRLPSDKFLLMTKMK